MTTEQEQPALTSASRNPVLTGGSSWFEYEGKGRPHVLRMELPVSAEEIASSGRWRDAMRPEMRAAWHALDRAQIILNREYADTGDEEIRRLKCEFERVAHALVDLVIDELFPETGTEDDDGGDV